MCQDFHVHTPQCILPPHMVEAIKMRGNAKQRGMCAKLEQSRLNFESRRTQTTPLNSFLASPSLTAEHSTPKPKLEVYDANQDLNLPGTRVEDLCSDPQAQEAFTGGEATFKLFLDVYKRNSIDGKGMRIIQTVHYDFEYNNAFWDGEQMVYGDGDGEIFKPLTGDLAVIGHELSHGVVQHSGGLLYRNQSGALNESFADVFGALVVQYTKGQSAAEANWLVGADILAPDVTGTALRSMKAPGTAYADDVLGKDPQPYHMDLYVHTFSDNGGVHINSGIPNHAFYLLSQYLGGNAWEKAGMIWYQTMQNINNPHASFSDWADQTMEEARNLYGAGSRELMFTRRAWKLVGVA